MDNLKTEAANHPVLKYIFYGKLGQIFHRYLNKSLPIENLRGNGMRKTLSYTLFTLTLLFLVNSVMSASADPWVATYDTNDNPKDNFLIGETVRIKAYSYQTPYTIEVWTSTDGGETWTHVKNIISDSQWYSGDHDDISKPPADRRYELRLYHANSKYATATYFVVPELGTLMVLAASFGALLWLRANRRL